MFDFFAASRVFLLAILPGWRLHQMAIAKLRTETKKFNDAASILYSILSQSIWLSRFGFLESARLK
jgi:hypothetical protein